MSTAPAAASLAQEVMLMLELRQSAALPPWAATRLATLCGARSHRVWRVFPAAAARVHAADARSAIAPDLPVLDELPEPVQRADMAQAIDTRQPVRTASGLWLVPLVAGGETRHLLELSHVAEHAHATELATTLIPLISSYYDLLVDAETDPLTGLANRRVFYSQVGAGIAGLAGGGRKRYLALADIDHFKQINDRFGHLYGDEILIHFARLLRDNFRAGDLLYRFGGEEFVILYSVDRDEERGAAPERFRAAVERYEFPNVGRVTASLGYTALRGGLVPATTIVDCADRAVYEAKRAGRNRVCEYEALVAQGILKPPRATAGGEATLF